MSAVGDARKRLTDRCEHGNAYDAACPPCDVGIAEAQKAGALTPAEIGLYWKGHKAGAAGHTRSQTDAGPDYCAECSEAVGEWIAWPCSPEAVVAATRAQERLYLSAEGRPS